MTNLPTTLGQEILPTHFVEIPTTSKKVGRERVLHSPPPQRLAGNEREI